MIKNIFLFFAGFLLSWILLFSNNTTVKNTLDPLFWRELYDITQEISTITSRYFPPHDEKNTQEALLRSFVSSLWDPYTTYITPKESISFQTMIQGDFEGIGAYIEDSSNGIYIADTLPGSPAQKSGLLPGDIIQSINGQTTFAMTAETAVLLIRGPAGSPVVLDIFSTILSTKKQVTLLRQKLEIPIVTDELIGDVLFIHLYSFNDYSGRDVEKALQKYTGQYKTILLDLRDNGGGTLDAAVDVASLFFSAPKIVSTIDGKDPQTFLSKGKTDVDIPVYILVNWQTASAAEILASALHEHLKAPLLGTQTYGKGSVQELFLLSNGAQIKVTIAHWLTAAGKKLDGIGITPDVIILPKIQDLITGKDGQKEEALAFIQQEGKNKNTP